MLYSKIIHVRNLSISLPFDILGKTDCYQFTALQDLSSLKVLRTISRSHDEAQKSHGKQIHQPMEYTF